MSECPFCRYAGPNPVIVDNVDAYVIEPLHPVTPGHELVIPTAHFEGLDWLPSGVLGSFFSLVASRARRAVVLAGGANVIVNFGAAASQTVPHLHVHIVPRRPGDGLQLPWGGQT